MLRSSYLVVLPLLALACATPARRVGTALPGEPRFDREPGRQIAYLGELRVPDNLGIERSAAEQVWAWLAGAETADTLYRPFAIAVAGDGRVAVADPGRHTVHVYDPLRRRYLRWPRADQPPLRYPVGVAFLGTRLYVTDSEARTLRAFDPDGSERAIAQPSWARPAGLAADPARRRLFITDVLSHQVYALSVDSAEAQVFGGRGEEPGQFNFPTHVAVDAAGRVYVTDALNFRVQVFDPELRPLLAFGAAGEQLGNLPRPKGLAVDRDGAIFVVDGLFGVIQAFDPTGELLGAFGGGGAGPGAFALPAGAAVDARGWLYVADTFNGRVQVFDLHAEATP